jgi:CcmD family protein
MTSFQYLALAYALIWGALATYLILLDRRLRRLADEVGELRRRGGRAGGL